MSMEVKNVILVLFVVWIFFFFFCLKESNFQVSGYERNMKNVSSEQLKVK